MRVKQLAPQLLQLVITEGSHHLHLDAPHTILSIVDHFLSKPWTTPSPAIIPTDHDMVTRFMHINPSSTTSSSHSLSLVLHQSKL
jgi:hypothetical protein